MSLVTTHQWTQYTILYQLRYGLACQTRLHKGYTSLLFFALFCNLPVISHLCGNIPESCRSELYLLLRIGWLESAVISLHLIIKAQKYNHNNIFFVRWCDYHSHYEIRTGRVRPTWAYLNKKFQCETTFEWKTLFFFRNAWNDTPQVTYPSPPEKLTASRLQRNPAASHGVPVMDFYRTLLGNWIGNTTETRF